MQNNQHSQLLGEDEEAKRMPLWQHLADLRQVLVRALIAIFLAWLVTYYFCDRIGTFLERPLLRLLPPGEAHLYYLGVAEKFLVYLKLSVYAAIGLVSPYLLYQIWWFVAPGLYRREKRFLLPFICFGSVTFVLGMLFAYYAFLPAAYKFFLNFGPQVDEPRITIKQYFSLTLKMLFTFGVIFEVPLLLILLGKFELIDAQTLTQYRRHAVLLTAVIAALISPTPDALSMVIIMAPLWLLYEISVVVVGWISRGK
jgi:sec-independent protein translocase protein TatC